MNYKLLFPTYRNRYLFIKKRLEALGKDRRFEHALNLGTGEGDYDAMIAPFCEQLTACDINAADIEFAKQLNGNIANINYEVQNALDLTYPDDTFDLIISVEVIEHVGEPAKMMEEIGRVLKPDGVAIITYPSLDFPFTYDPINRFLSLFTKKKIAQGAYAFGHEYLISPPEFKDWSKENNLNIEEDRNLSGYFIGLAEMYWTGIIQSIFKANSTNLAQEKKKSVSFRPSIKEPFLTKLTDILIHLDYALFKKSKYSVGKGYLLQKSK